ncbi:uncharacterized protein LOC110447374 [Mizuhopecten yessoensis]|uniref:uncharacterized protein LOC110447374 n=1 Tax=Mizuhopecten yessoensis TaxID=6573 RepID=UPI000B459882|nr:uncharacterized protein LOC110447374 [Mizuhopecten yessoensis]XP_021348688.1 uncharacterized protein LOC110447374 [Mizuhopecten yessoensis]XP_021348689.1 uncharacterized protein LOC110447374 [Mizuhopecten yessoensis]
MNQQTLLYHTKLQDWSQIYHLKADGRVCKASKVPYLPAHKLQQIEVWRKDVSKTLRKTCSARPDRSQSKATKDVRPISEIVRTNTPFQVNGHEKPRPRSAWSNSTNDMQTVTSNLAETSLHYAAQREQLHKVNASRSQSIRINRKQVTHTGDAKAPAERCIRTEGGSPLNQAKEIIPNGEVKDMPRDEDDEQDNLSDVEVLSSVTQFRMENRGHMIQVKDQTVLSMRSQSNNLLNVLSVDDCKMAIRSRLRNRVIQDHEQNGEANSDEKHSDTNSIGRLTLDKSRTSYGRRTGADKVNETASKLGRDTKVPVKSRTAKITKAIDNMVHDRKVMNDLDRNFDSRIGSTARITLERAEGGKIFKRLNSALKKHVNGLLMHQSASQRKFYTQTVISSQSDTLFDGDTQYRSGTCTPSEGARQGESALSNVTPTHPDISGLDSYRGIPQTPAIPEEMEDDQESYENSIT